MPQSYKYLVTIPDEWNVTKKRLNSEFDDMESAFQFAEKLMPYCQPLITEVPQKQFVTN